MKREKILVSISGGRTSAMMAALIKKRYSSTHDIAYVFANTSREKDKSLDFLYKIDQYFQLGIIWIEAVVNHGERKACTHKIVDYYSAKRDGSVFREVIKKYGIPCAEAPHCTRELKTNPIKSLAKEIGFGEYGKDYLSAIGYRADEPKRIKRRKIENERHFYLLADMGIRKQDVAKFFSEMPFDLEIKDYEGNCKLCHKKSRRKILTQLAEHPEDADWIVEMENKYGMVAPSQYSKELPLRFFRERESIIDLIEESKLPFDKAIDRSKDTNGFNIFLDFSADMDYEDADCGNSCEPFG